MRIGSFSKPVLPVAGTPKVEKASEHFDPTRQGRAVTKLAEREADAKKQLSTPPLDPAVERMLAEQGVFPKQK
jgi:hypothetical protein